MALEILVLWLRFITLLCFLSKNNKQKDESPKGKDNDRGSYSCFGSRAIVAGKGARALAQSDALVSTPCEPLTGAMMRNGLASAADVSSSVHSM